MSELTAEDESLDSERAFSMSARESSGTVFFLPGCWEAFLGFLFGEPTLPTSNLGHRI